MCRKDGASAPFELGSESFIPRSCPLSKASQKGVVNIAVTDRTGDGGKRPRMLHERRKASRKSYPALHLATRITCMSPRCQVDHSTDTRESDEPPRVLELLRIGTPAGSPQIQFREIPFRVDRQPTTYNRVTQGKDPFFLAFQFQFCIYPGV
jgi:hypothetical protein